MGEVLGAILTMVIGMVVLGLLLSALYGLTLFVPRHWRERTQMWVFLFPAMFALLIGLMVPAVRTVVTSFRDDRNKKWIGIENYTEIFSGKDTRLTVFNTVTWVVVGTFLTCIVGLAVARYSDGVRGEKAMKSLIFIPAAISLAGAGIIWKFVYAGPPFEVGLLNQITKAIPGLPASLGGNGDKLWLIDRSIGSLKPPGSAPGANTFLLIVIFIWASTGFATVVFSAAIKGVPETLIEAAKVDGADDKVAFYKVTLPYIRATIVTVATTVVIGALKAYDIVASSTGGNFGTSTIANDYYTLYFVQGRNGFASAMAVLLLLLVFPVVVINRRAQSRAEELMGA